jgi:hypothetical protein
VPPPLLLADKHTRAGAYLQKAGGLPAAAGPGRAVRRTRRTALGAEGVVSSSRTLLSCFHSISVARHVARQAASFTC